MASRGAISAHLLGLLVVNIVKAKMAMTVS